MFLSLSFSLFLSKSMNIFLDEDFKKTYADFYRAKAIKTW